MMMYSDVLNVCCIILYLLILTPAAGGACAFVVSSDDRLGCALDCNFLKDYSRK